MRTKRQRGFWAMQLDNAVRHSDEQIVLVAQGLACLAVVRWAQLSPKSYVENVAAAILFSPLSFQLAQAPLAKELNPSPQIALPFPSTVIESKASLQIERVLSLADLWQSRFVDVTIVPDEWVACATHPESEFQQFERRPALLPGKGSPLGSRNAHR